MPNEMRYGHILNHVVSTPWAIEPSKLAEIMVFLSAKSAGETIDPAIVAEYRAAAQSRQKQQRQGSVGVLPITGTIGYRMNLMSEMSGGTSVEALTRDLRAMLNDPDISAIVLDVDSPGGTVDGLTELASEIYQGRSQKPITAVANTMMASGAYWLASAASEIAVSPSALVGSIGVIAAHEDQSGLYEKLGVDVSLVTAGKYKGENNPFGPLTEDGKAQIQKRVDEYYGMFTRDVAKGRRVPVESVRGGFGEGRVVGAKEAISLGMADRMATRDEIVATIGRTQNTGDATARLVVSDVPGDQPLIHRVSVAPLTFENEAETALSAVRSFTLRCAALSALRKQRNQSPIAEANVPRLNDIIDALDESAIALQAIVDAHNAGDVDRMAAAREARLRLLDLDMLIAGVQ